MTTKLKEKVIVASRLKHLKLIGWIVFIIWTTIFLISANSEFRNIMYNLELVLSIIALLAWRTLVCLSKFPLDVLKNGNLMYITFSMEKVAFFYLVLLLFIPMIIYLKPYLVFNFACILFMSAILILLSVASAQISRYCKSQLSNEKK